MGRLSPSLKSGLTSRLGCHPKTHQPVQAQLRVGLEALGAPERGPQQEAPEQPGFKRCSCAQQRMSEPEACKKEAKQASMWVTGSLNVRNRTV